MGHEPVEITGKQILLESGRDAVGEDRRRTLLVRPEDVAHALFAQIVRRVRLPQHRQLLPPALAVRLELRNLVGDDVLMLDRDGGDLETNHLPDLASVVAGGAHDVLAGDVALVRPDEPLAARPALHRRHPSVLVDLGAAIPGTLGQRHGQIHRSDVPVVRMVERAEQTLDFTKRPELLHLARRDHLERHADRVRRAAILVVLVHAVPRAGEPEIAGHVEANRLASLLLEALVKIHRVLVNLPDRIAHVEQRQQSRGVPGGAGGQLGALTQHDIRPALARQMIKGAHADDASADDDYSSLCFHLTSPDLCACTPRAGGGAIWARPAHSLTVIARRAHGAVPAPDACGTVCGCSGNVKSTVTDRAPVVPLATANL